VGEQIQPVVDKVSQPLNPVATHLAGSEFDRKGDTIEHPADHRDVRYVGSAQLKPVIGG
jgi:hypothetical protein